MNFQLKSDASKMGVFRGGVAISFISMALLGCNSSPAPQASSAAQPIPAPSVQPVEAPASKWQISKDVNELDHKAQITISSSDVILRCSPKFEGYVIPYIPSLGHSLDSDSDHGQTVRYRIDNGPIHRQEWSISEDFTALFLPTPTLRAALNGKELVVEFQPDYVSAQTQTFDLDGLKAAAKNAGCKI